MKIFTLRMHESKNSAWRAAVASVLFVVLFSTAAPCGEIEDSLPPNSSDAVKASTLQAIQNGLAQENVVKLTRAMLQSKFNEQQIQLSHALMI